jgi:predicted ribosome quality control (RQC) complex YloA/Tae2 family protein
MPPYHLLLRLRGGGRAGALRLLIAIAASGRRLHPPSYRYLNPPRPLRFLSYLRHHFQGAKIDRLEKVAGDRIVILRGRRRNEEEKQLVVELCGKNANAALCSGPKMLVGARMLDLPGAVRLLPGTPWQPPEPGPAADTTPTTLITATGRPDPEEITDDELFRLYDDWFYPRYQQNYGGREIKNLIKALKQRRKRLVRRERKLAAEEREKEAHLDDARLADLFKTRLHEIARGARSIRVVDYWSEDLKEIEIPLDPALSPQANLEKFYKNAKKARRGIKMIAARRAETEQEKDYLQEIIFQLEELLRGLELVDDTREEEARELLELAADLAGKRQPEPSPAKKKKGGRKQNKQVRPSGHKSSRTRGTTRIEGVAGGIIYLGLNALGNENIYRRLGAPEDLWFHVKGRPGAHVLLKTAPGRPESEAEIAQAARLAATNSPARNEPKVEVTICRLKHLKKPKHARPGLVLLAGPVKTLTVSPRQPNPTLS